MAKHRHRGSKFDEIFDDPFRKSGNTYGVGGILASLFRRILAEREIHPNFWEKCMQRYIFDMRKRISDPKRLMNERGNISKELLNEEQTWKVFCKGLTFLRFSKVKFIAEVTDANGKTTRHEVPVNFGLSQTEADAEFARSAYAKASNEDHHNEDDKEDNPALDGEENDE